MKSFLALSLTFLLASSAMANTTNNLSNKDIENADINESYTLEQIATKTQTLNNDLQSDLNLLIPTSVNNTFRVNGKDAVTTISTNDTNTTTTITK